jgi:hypothetical protein
MELENQKTALQTELNEKKKQQDLIKGKLEDAYASVWGFYL